MGLAVSIFLFTGAIVFWQLGILAKTDAWRLRPILATFLVCYLAFAVCSWEYFFAPPVITELLIALCVGLAFVASRRASATQSNHRGSSPAEYD